ncbi:hypothetical protein [Streptosporangium sp. NPDC023615]|uniref:hypothetical protein n=1 Tax=Streptosporangium sp. NPDC023615 TaxID=3154794 RepID=UPI003443D1E4
MQKVFIRLQHDRKARRALQAGFRMIRLTFSAGAASFPPRPRPVPAAGALPFTAATFDADLDATGTA